MSELRVRARANGATICHAPADPHAIAAMNAAGLVAWPNRTKTLTSWSCPCGKRLELKAVWCTTERLVVGKHGDWLPFMCLDLDEEPLP